MSRYSKPKLGLKWLLIWVLVYQRPVWNVDSIQY
jgi:hypothetical protein